MRLMRDPPTVQTATLSLTSMIDVVFLLLIFFMVGMQLRDPERRLEASLPRTGPGSEAGLLDEMQVSVDRGRDGKVSLRLDGRRVSSWQTLERLFASIARVPGATRRTTVLLDAGDQAEHGWVLHALDLARRARFERVAFRR